MYKLIVGIFGIGLMLVTPSFAQQHQQHRGPGPVSTQPRQHNVEPQRHRNYDRRRYDNHGRYQDQNDCAVVVPFVRVWCN